MATLDDIVESNILNAEYLQNINELQKDQYKEQIDTANSMGNLDDRFKQFFISLRRERLKNEETLRESRESAGDESIGQGGSESTFKKVAGAGAVVLVLVWRLWVSASADSLLWTCRRRQSTYMDEYRSHETHWRDENVD